MAASESRAPPSSACGWEADGRAAAAVSRWVNAVSTQPSWLTGLQLPERGSRTVGLGLGPGRVTSRTSSPGGPVRVGSPHGQALRSRLPCQEKLRFLGAV